MDGRRRTFAAAATLCFVFVFVFFRGASAARPLAAPTTSPETAAMEAVAASAPAAAATWQRGGEDEGKWLPLPVATALAGGLRFPGGAPSLPWPFAGNGPPAAAGGFGGPAGPGMGMPAGPGMGMPAGTGMGMPAGTGMGLPAGLVPPYVGATRQEQLSVWASLFNPFQVRPRMPGLPAAEASSSSSTTGPAVASGGVQRTTTVDEPAAAGQPKWGVFLGTTPTQNNNG